MNSKHLKDIQNGFAFLEAALAMTIVLPAAIALVSLIDFLQMQSGIGRIIESAALSSEITPFKMNTGDQGYFLSSRGRPPVHPKYDVYEQSRAKVFKYNRSLIALVKNIHEDLADLLDCHENCKYPFRVELRTAGININIQSGAVAGIPDLKPDDEEILKIKPKKLPENHVEWRYYDLETPSSNSSSKSPFSRNYLIEKMREEADTNEVPFKYAVASSLYNISQDQFYGDTQGRTYMNKEDKLNYLRAVNLIGISIQVDLSHSLAGAFIHSWKLKRLLLRKEIKDTPPSSTLSTYRILVARQEL